MADADRRERHRRAASRRARGAAPRAAAARSHATARCFSTSTARCSTSRRRPIACASTATSRRCCRALARRLGGALALITGRSIADADRLFPGARAADRRTARHRAPRRPTARSICTTPRRRDSSALRRELAAASPRATPGLLLEDKGATLALHYRRAPRLASHVHRDAARAAARPRSAADWRLQPGKGMLEVQPDGRDKGTAIVEFMAEPPFAGRTAGVRRRRSAPTNTASPRSSALGGWAVKVGPRPHARALSAARRRRRCAHWLRRACRRRRRRSDATEAPDAHPRPRARSATARIGLLVDRAGDDRLGLLSALRRRPDVLRAARRSRRRAPSAASSRSTSSTWRAAEQSYVDEHRGAGDAPLRQRRAAPSRSPTACRASCSTAACSIR